MIRIKVLEQYYDRTLEFIVYISEHPILGKIPEDCIDALCLAVTGMLGLKNGLGLYRIIHHWIVVVWLCRWYMRAIDPQNIL